MLSRLAIVLFALTASLSATATSVSFLWGDNFREDLGYEEEKLTMTIEHFAVWEKGTVFFYYDITEPMSRDNGDDNQFFGGIAPTFSLSKITGKDLSTGWLRDVSIRVELENGSGGGSNSFRNYFYGLQYDIALPGFDFFSLNTVLRDNPNQSGVGFQIGSYWQMTWDFGPWNHYKFTGFIATSPWDGNQPREKDQSKNEYMFAERGKFLTAQPQFLWDLGHGLWRKSNRVELGVEYAYFINRYQIKDKDEKCLQAMVKFSY